MISNAALLHSLIPNLEDVSGYDLVVHSPVDASVLASLTFDFISEVDAKSARLV